ncbi:MAG: hypothetical protein AAF141_08490 [Pseudomonadota bacterium]
MADIKEHPTVAVLPLGRPTFDVEFAGEKLAAMLALLDSSDARLVGSRELLFDADAARAALDALPDEIDLVLILQVTFTDAGMAVEIANRLDAPLAIWSVREPREGGRLRLNSFCGLNLATHALTKSGIELGYLYADPDPTAAQPLSELLTGGRRTRAIGRQSVANTTQEAERAKVAVEGSRIARIGVHPDGFDTCAYDEDELHSLAGVEVEALQLDDLFSQAKASAREDVADVRVLAERDIDGLDQVDADELDRSLRLKVALDHLKAHRKADAFAIRCWPETFTEYGGAICGPVSMMGEARVPCACEADVYGALTQLYLQALTGSAPFLVDLVDIDPADDTAVVWHCGQAPISMRSQRSTATATIHTNRKMPLLYEFTLKPGPVTFMRVSQARGEPCIVVARGEMIDRPMAFTGTSGVFEIEGGAARLLSNTMDAGLEHHMALVYGDWTADIAGLSAALGLPLVEL